jgi:cyanoexosortase A
MLKDQTQQIRQIINHKIFYLLVALACLASLHFYYIWKINNHIPSLIDILGWSCTGFLLWKRGNKIKIRSSFISTILGVTLIIWMIIRHTLSQSNSAMDALSFVFPIVNFVGLLLITVGFKQLINYKSELAIMSLMSIPTLFVSTTVLSPIAHIDARLMTFILHYIGFTVSRQNTTVLLSKGAVEVMGGCSSIIPLVTVFALLVMLTSLYAAKRKQQTIIYTIATVAVFLINSIRLCLLAVLVNNGNNASFEYWHSGGGAAIFSNIIVVIVGGISYKILEDNLQTQ